MSFGGWYWLVLFLLAVCGCWHGALAPPADRWARGGGGLLLFILLCLLGWKVFGSPLSR